MEILRNPETGTVGTFTAGQARIRRAKGWADAGSTSGRQTRAELDLQAQTLGLDPSSYRTKADLQAAIDATEPA